MSGMSTRAASVGSVLLAAALVAGCAGGGSSSASGAAPATSGPTTAPGAAPTGAPGAGRGFGGNPQQLAAIRQCLQAAGLPVPSIDPSRRFSPGARPSFSPRPRPTGTDGTAGTGGRRIFADPKVQAALKACGITVPTFRPRPSGQGQGPGQAANASPPAQ